MANEISANNIKQSYDLAENKIFPKTTINGIVFDSDDSVVGSSAIVKSLVKEDLKVRNIEVDTDSSTGGYIHLKTNNDDGSGIGVLELKLGHKSLNDGSTNKIYINDKDDSNTDVSAFFKKMQIISNEYAGEFGTATVKSGSMILTVDNSGVVVKDGSVTSDKYYVGESGSISTFHKGSIEICSDNIVASNIKHAVFADNKIQLDSDSNCIDIHGGKGNIKIGVDASGDISDIYMKNGECEIFETGNTIGLKSNNVVVYNDEGAKTNLYISENEHCDKCAILSFDASKDMSFDMQLNYNEGDISFTMYPIQYSIDVEGKESYLHLRAHTSGNESSYIYVDGDSIDASTWGGMSLHSAGNLYITSDTSILINAPSITGTVNGKNDVLMGVPIGSVVKWPNINAHAPEGWVSYADICKKLLQLDYVGIMYTDRYGEERLCRLIDASLYTRTVDIMHKAQAFGYAVDTSIYESFKYCAGYYTLYAGCVYIDGSNREVYHIFKFREYPQYKGFYDNFRCSVGKESTKNVDFAINIYGGHSSPKSFKFNNDDGSVYNYLGVFDTSKSNLLLFKIKDSSANYIFMNVSFSDGTGNVKDILWNNNESRFADEVLQTIKADYGKNFYFSGGDIFKYK